MLFVFQVIDNLPVALPGMRYFSRAKLVRELRGVVIDPLFGDLSVQIAQHRGAYEFDLAGATVIGGFSPLCVPLVKC